MIATIDSGAMHTMISSRTIEKYKIPHRVKKTPIPVVLADDKPMDYGNGMIRLETEPVTLELAGTISTMRINIMDLGEEEILIGYDWLQDHNPAIDWQKKTILSQEPARKVARVQQETRPTNQSSPKNGRFSKISPHKIARIYAKDPQQVGVI